MKDYCFNCKFRKDCELADNVNFCEDCRDYHNCNILSCCDGGYYVECNNGFEPKDYCCDIYERDEDYSYLDYEEEEYDDD